MRTFLILLCAAAILSGCASSPTDHPSSMTAAGAPPPAQDAAPSQAPATTSSGPAPAATRPQDQAQATNNTTAAPATRTLPVKFAGSDFPSVCAYAVVAGLCTPWLEGRDMAELGPAKRVVSGTLTLTWDADSPINAKMGVSLGAIKPCGDGCYQITVLSNDTRALGASPLTMAIKTPVAVPTGALALWVWKPCEVQNPDPPVQACAFTNQAFQVQGSLVVEP